MSTKNTVTDGQTKNKGRFDGPFSYHVNTMVIMSIYKLLSCNLPGLQVPEFVLLKTLGRTLTFKIWAPNPQMQLGYLQVELGGVIPS